MQSGAVLATTLIVLLIASTATSAAIAPSRAGWKPSILDDIDDEIHRIQATQGKLDAEVLRHELAAALGAGGPLPGAHSRIGYGNLATAAATGWPYCDFATIFVVHSGPPGSSVSAAHLSDVPATALPMCEGTVGRVRNWDHIEMSAGSAVEACGAATVMVPPSEDDTQVTATGAVACGAQMLSAVGQGVLTSRPYFGLTIDFFVGADARITLE